MYYDKSIPEAACGAVDEIKRMCAAYEEEITELRAENYRLRARLSDRGDRDENEDADLMEVAK